MEKYELVDINGKKAGKIITDKELENKNNIPTRHYMPVVGVLIINNKNEILLQKRSRFKKINPNKWGICGGKVNLNEDTVTAILRETVEEIGINLNKDDLKILTKISENGTYYTTYYIRQDVNISECIIQKEELEELRYFKIEDLKNLDNEGFEWLEKLKEII